MKETVPVAPATMPGAVLVEREAFGQLVCAVKDGLLALSIGAGSRAERV